MSATRGSSSVSEKTLSSGQRGERPSSLNKIYRAPPTPPWSEVIRRERSFILDCRAMSCIAGENAKYNPKLGGVLPPYNAQKDALTQRYWQFSHVDKTLRRTGQHKGGTSIDGHVIDYFHEKGPGTQYLNLRNRSGAGHSGEVTDGHTKFMEIRKPMIGYNGICGYRRNTPWLRNRPSTFGVATRSPIY